jgi:hypothetical protein
LVAAAVAVAGKEVGTEPVMGAKGIIVRGGDRVVEHIEADFITNFFPLSDITSTMEPWMAYLLIIIGALLVLYFAYLSYQTYQRNPSRWVLRELATEWALRLWK